MSKAGQKIINGLKEAHAVAKGDKLPARLAVGGDVQTGLTFLQLVFDAALRSGRQANVQIRIEFPPPQKTKKEKRAYGRKS